MGIIKVFAGIGILSLLAIIGSVTFADKEPIIINERYSENCNVDLTLKYDDNNIQAAHTDVLYSTYNNTVTIYDSDIEDFYGSSMEPTIFPGNKLIKTRYEKDKLKEGIIIGFKSGDKILVHRIKALYIDHILTQGDANDYPEKVNYDDVEYIVLGVLFS